MAEKLAGVERARSVLFVSWDCEEIRSRYLRVGHRMCAGKAGLDERVVGEVVHLIGY